MFSDQVSRLPSPCVNHRHGCRPQSRVFIYQLFNQYTGRSELPRTAKAIEVLGRIIVLGEGKMVNKVKTRTGASLIYNAIWTAAKLRRSTTRSRFRSCGFQHSAVRCKSRSSWCYEHVISCHRPDGGTISLYCTGT